MQAIFDAPKNAWCEVDVECVGLLIDGADYYRAFYHAALQAERSIVIAGWQFDSDVELLRGADAERAETPVTLRDFLNALCERRPQLQIYVLAWDFHLVFAIEREWLQTVRFGWSTNERLHFLFDSQHVAGGSHHQKFVVIDGQVTFLGGIDLCDHRWDESTHKANHPLRISRGEPHRPFHDLQLYLRGEAPAAAISALFARRWLNAGGAPLELSKGDERSSRAAPHGLVPLDAGSLWLSRTDPLGVPDGAAPCREIEQQYLGAIAGARRLLYIETQYLSSHVIAEALEARLLSTAEQALEIVIVLNLQGENFKEQTAVGLAQAQIIGRLRDAAATSTHHLGIYYTLSADGVDGHTTYVHSKLMIVDDQTLIVGSANLTNRSLSLDTELNAILMAEKSDDPLSRSLTALRTLLLQEHSGGGDYTAIEGLVARLDETASHPAAPTARLRRHPSPTPDERTILALIDPQKLPFDPDFCEDAEQDGTFGDAFKTFFGLDETQA